MNQTAPQPTNALSLRSLLLALVVALFGGAALAQETATATGGEEVVIQVDGETTLTQAQFEEEFDRAIRSLARQQGLPFNEQTRALFDRFREDFLNQLATQEALLREAEARGLTVPEEEIDAQITAAQESLGGEEAFTQAIQELGYQDVEAYRQYVREGLLAQRVVEELRAGLEITDEDVQTYFEQNQDLFGDAAFEDAQDQVRAQLENERLTQRFTELQAQYGVQTNPDVILAGDAEEGVAGGGEGEATEPTEPAPEGEQPGTDTTEGEQPGTDTEEGEAEGEGDETQ